MFAQGEERIRFRRLNELRLAGGKVVDTDNGVAKGKQTVRNGAADEAGGAGDKYAHSSISCFRSPGAAPHIPLGEWWPAGGESGGYLSYSEYFRKSDRGANRRHPATGSALAPILPPFAGPATESQRRTCSRRFPGRRTPP